MILQVGSLGWVRLGVSSGLGSAHSCNRNQLLGVRSWLSAVASVDHLCPLGFSASSRLVHMVAEHERAWWKLRGLLNLGLKWLDYHFSSV